MLLLTTPPSLLQHSCPPSLTPPLTCIHPAPCVCCVQGLLSCICCHFSVGGVLILFSVWFCIVSLSPVSRQWFYPMVGDIMLFYHRVEPRTGCWRVSASVRPSVSPYPPPINPKVGSAGGLGSAWFWCCSWWWYCWWALILSNMHLFVCFFNSTLCIYPSVYMCCLHRIYLLNSDCRMCVKLLMYCIF